MSYVDRAHSRCRSCSPPCKGHTLQRLANTVHQRPEDLKSCEAIHNLWSSGSLAFKAGTCKACDLHKRRRATTNALHGNRWHASTALCGANLSHQGGTDAGKVDLAQSSRGKQSPTYMSTYTYIYTCRNIYIYTKIRLFTLIHLWFLCIYLPI